jgi:fluoride exporter
VVAQATLRLASELQCERVIRLAHERGVASATAYRGPEGVDSPIFVMLLDRVEDLGHFLPELRETVPGAAISVIQETVEHVFPADFLNGGAIRPRPLRAEVGHLGWVFAGGSLGGGARLLVESAASYVSPARDVFPWGTMLVNAIGSFAIAVLGTLLIERFLGERERMFWVLGFLGSFTTFSSFALQTTESWAVSPLLGVLYGGGSILLGLLGALLGLKLARTLI